MTRLLRWKNGAGKAGRGEQLPAAATIDAEVAKVTVATDALKAPRAPVTDQTVKRLEKAGFSSDFVALAKQLARD
jgi:hypothetical protein